MAGSGDVMESTHELALSLRYLHMFPVAEFLLGSEVFPTYSQKVFSSRAEILCRIKEIPSCKVLARVGSVPPRPRSTKPIVPAVVHSQSSQHSEHP